MARCTRYNIDKVCQWLVAGQWFSPVSSNNKTDRHDIAEILLKVALNILTLILAITQLLIQMYMTTLLCWFWPIMIYMYYHFYIQVLKVTGWKVVAAVGSLYFMLYLYEWLCWTNKAKERRFKSQYVEYAASKLRLIVDLTSSNCSHQVQQ
jgi:hypothetical protein